MLAAKDATMSQNQVANDSKCCEIDEKSSVSGDKTANSIFDRRRRRKSLCCIESPSSNAQMANDVEFSRKSTNNTSIHEIDRRSDVDGILPNSPISTVQFTSIDGFFNRKRGRPPKNRYVQVYKNLQLPPQAIFTSFKLERRHYADLENPLKADHFEEHPISEDGVLFSAENTDVDVIYVAHAQKSDIPQLCAPERSTQRSIVEIDSCCASKNSFTFARQQPCSSAEREEIKSVVRAKGTYFPEHFSALAAQNKSNVEENDPDNNRKSSQTKSATQFTATVQDMPEDLSVHRSSMETHQLLVPQSEAKLTQNSNPFDDSVEAKAFAYLSMMHLIDLYYRQQQQEQYNKVLQPLRYPITSTISQNPSEPTQLLTSPANVQSWPPLPLREFSSRPHSATLTPSGYSKYRFSEDCRRLLCAYRQHQTHFHCDREECQYSFCDKTRFVQHTARHKRLDTLLAGDFKQFRVNMDCGYRKCRQMTSPASKKSSHFHCLKCPFSCSETSKVTAHRRFHSKLDYIRSVGFRKVSSSEDCSSGSQSKVSDSTSLGSMPPCVYSLKQTHYHCLICDFRVLSKGQLAMHRHKSTS